MKSIVSILQRAGSRVFAEAFANSAGVLLLASALLLFWCNADNTGLMSPRDSLVGLSLRLLFWIVGGVMVAASFICIFARAPVLRITIAVWLAINLLALQFGLARMGSQAMVGCFANVAGNFGLPAAGVQIVAESVWLCLLAGGVGLMIWFWVDGRKAGVLAEQVATGEMLRSCCPACGGHIVFPNTRVGQAMPCPHCSETMTLRPGTIKMSCYFCKGHIEYPSHALGTKMSCPHCKKDITLKELPVQ